MKNEKLTKNELKEKMMKKFDVGMVVAWAIRNFFIIFAVVNLIVFIAAVTEQVIQVGGSNFIQTAIKVVNELITETNISNKNNLFFLIGEILKYMLLIIICDRIGRVFKVSKEAETPFCGANVRNIGIISNLAWIYTIFCVEGFGGYEMVTATLITVIYYIFKYGCELQEQSDETL